MRSLPFWWSACAGALLAASVFCPAARAGGILPVTYDTMIDVQYPDANRDGYTYALGAGSYNEYERRSLLWFDLAAVTEPITSATLSMYCYGSQHSGTTMTAAVHQVTSPWIASQATWNHRIKNDPVQGTWTWGTAGGDFALTPVDTAAVGATSAYYEWDVTSLVQFWKANPTLNYGLILKDTAPVTGNYKQFYSREINGNNPDRRPALLINMPAFRFDVPEPSTAVLIGLGLLLAPLMLGRRSWRRLRGGARE